MFELSRRNSPTSSIFDPIESGGAMGFRVPGSHANAKCFRVPGTSARGTRFWLNIDGIPTTSRFVREMSTPGMEEAPDQRADPVEGLESIFCLGLVDCSGGGEEPEVAVDLFCRRIGDPPQVHAVAAGTAMAFGEVGGH